MRNRLKQPKSLKSTEIRTLESNFRSSPPLTSSPVISPKPPNLRSNPNEKKQIQSSLLYRRTLRLNPTKSTTTKIDLNPVHTIEEKDEKYPSRTRSPNAIAETSLQKEIKTATQFALKIVQNYRDRKSAENDAWSASPTCYKEPKLDSNTPDVFWLSQTLTSAIEKSESDDWETTDMSESGLGLSRYERTPKKRDVQDFFRTSQKYGDSILKMLKNEDFEQGISRNLEGKSPVSISKNRPKSLWDPGLKSNKGLKPFGTVRKLRRMQNDVAVSHICDVSAPASSNTTPTKSGGSKLKRTFAKAKFILKNLQNDK